MVEKITDQHLLDYIQKEYNEYIGNINDVKESIVYEAFCEMIVELNESYCIENLAEEYEQRLEKSERAFLKNKLDTVIDDSITKSLGEKEFRKFEEKWISSTTTGMKEI